MMALWSYSAGVAGLETSLIRKVFDAAPPGALNLGLGQPDLPVPEVVRAAAERALVGGMAPYTPNVGTAALRAGVARMYAQWRARGEGVGAWLEADGVLVTAGVQEGLYVALAALCEPGAEVLVPDPGFPAYEMIARSVGAVARPYACGEAEGFGPTLAAVQAALTPKTAAVVFNSPSNPTGALADPRELEALCGLLDEAHIPWVSDEIYDRYTYEGARFVSPSAYSSRGLVLGGLSKSANMMGWRLGWIVAPPAQLRPLVSLHQVVCTCASSLTQAAAVAAVEALGGGEGAEQMQANLDIFAARRARALRALQELGLRPAASQGAFYLWLDLRERLRAGEDDLRFCLRVLNEQRLILIPGRAFGPQGEGWIRLAYTSEALEDGIARLGRALSIS
jgi:aspartate/methionine/tyrosine aminotransferase